MWWAIRRYLGLSDRVRRHRPGGAIGHLGLKGTSRHQAIRVAGRSESEELPGLEEWPLSAHLACCGRIAAIVSFLSPQLALNLDGENRS